MIQLEEHKQATEHSPIEKAPLPQKAYIPLSQHLGRVCTPEVKLQDQVAVGRRIGSAQAHVWAPVHASVSGKVSAIQDWPHPVLGSCRTVVIENDGQDTGVSAYQAVKTEEETPTTKHPASPR
ncbi:MAG: electron transporter RnfC, partial [Candidatus Omnitrophica bacterium]|nr:electron transporter RnfC [Candidatus Omnitrophota bacterium]